MSTIRDVATRANVSIATVSRVINNSPHRVGRETREKVLKAIQELDYRPNALAQGLIMKRSMTIGIIIPDISNPYYAEIVRGIQDAADRAGYAIVLQNTDRKKEKIIKCIHVLRDKKADGIIFSGGIIHGYETLSVLGELNSRVVVIGRHEVDFPAVRVDNIGGATQAIQHLVDLGHERICFINGPEMSTTSIDRQRGYKNALAKNNLPFDRELLKRGNLTAESGYLAAKEVLKLRRRPTAIFTSNDLMAFGAICAARELGMEVPGDLAVVGFDNIPLCTYFDPPLSTVEIPMYELGLSAMRMLFDLINQNEFDRYKILKTRLIIRESSQGKNA
ncbi:MAG: LacI family DNA-binding transcriptional regulator [Deltaproteobacteria bacterium]|nr:LacI family DNA-binding transcriptional regulator [Deltaproteobacteria bacterium]